MDTPTIRVKQVGNFPKADTFDLCVFVERDGHIYPAEAVRFSEEPANGAVSESVTLSKASAQILLDDLIAAGLRPSAKPNLEGILAAKNDHISNLFDIVKGLLPSK